jgi:hypothetical protein
MTNKYILDGLTRARLGIVFIVGVVLAISARQLYSAITHLRALPPTSYASQYEQRFSEVKRSLQRAQIVSYKDDFIMPEECGAFVLAQYSVAPVILATQHSICGHLSDKTPGLSLRSELLLENLHDPRIEPYLPHLFPQRFGLWTQLRASANRESSPGEQVVLLKDFGQGVKLYARVAQ